MVLGIKWNVINNNCPKFNVFDLQNLCANILYNLFQIIV
jgi:hypothetical protein